MDEPWVSNEYIILKELSNSYLGHTYLAYSKETSGKVVIKTMLKRMIGESKSIESFIFNLKKIMAIESNFVIKYSSFVEYDDRVCLFRPYIECTPLSEYLAISQPLEISQVISLWRAVVQCYSFLHKAGFSPNAIKPNNIFIHEDKYVLISDVYELVGEMSSVLNTPVSDHLIFLAPEIFMNQKMGPKTDVWALGVLLCSVSGIKIPWDIKNVFGMIRQITSPSPPLPSNINRNIYDMLHQMLQHDPEQRPTIDVIEKIDFVPSALRRVRKFSERIPSKYSEIPTKLAKADDNRFSSCINMFCPLINTNTPPITFGSSIMASTSQITVRKRFFTGLIARRKEGL